jgi:hypothetical protein
MGVIHRDLKPSNIMITSRLLDDTTHEVKIVDFGIAKLQSTDLSIATNTGEIFGSPAYMSPEQALGRTITDSTDQYSLGCILFECLSGFRPFVADNPLSTLMKHVSEKPPSVVQACAGRSEISAGMVRCIERLLAKDPNKRFRSMKDVQEFLEKQCGKNGVLVEEEKRQHQLRFRLSAGIVISSCVAAIAVVGYLIASMNSQPSEREVQASFLQKQVSPLDTGHEVVQGGEIGRWLIENPGARSANFSHRKFRPFALTPLANCHYLTDLQLGGSDGLANGALRYITGLPLQSLRLDATDVTSADMVYLNQLKDLQYLDLHLTRVDDAGLTSLSRLPRLDYLDLRHTGVTDLGIKTIATMPVLNKLLLDDTAVTDVSPLSKRPFSSLRLKRLKLKRSNLAAIGKMKTLHLLSLDGTAITDADLLWLKGLKNLEDLSLNECPNLTDGGVRRLQTILPNCKIRREPVNPGFKKRMMLMTDEPPN